MTLLRRARPLAVTCVAVATLLVGGCGDDSSDGGGGGDGGGDGGTDDPTALCADVDALRTSLADVTQVPVAKGAVADLQDQLDEVRTDVSTLIADAQDEYGDEVAAVDEAVSDLTTRLEEAAASPSVDTLSAVRTARQQLMSSVDALTSAVRDTC
jgi:hypothetical protein